MRKVMLCLVHIIEARRKALGILTLLEHFDVDQATHTQLHHQRLHREVDMGVFPPFEHDLDF